MLSILYAVINFENSISSFLNQLFWSETLVFHFQFVNYMSMADYFGCFCYEYELKKVDQYFLDCDLHGHLHQIAELCYYSCKMPVVTAALICLSLLSNLH